MKIIKAKLNQDGITAHLELDNGTMCSMSIYIKNRYSEVLDEWIANGGVIEPFETQAEIDARIVTEENRKTIEELKEIDIASIRSIREYIASLPDAPQILKDRETQAILSRARIVK